LKRPAQPGESLINQAGGQSEPVKTGFHLPQPMALAIGVPGITESSQIL